MSVAESVIKEFLDAQLPFEVEAGSFKVTLARGEAVFKGSPAVPLTGGIAPAGHPDLKSEVRAQGALENIRVDPESGTLRATVAIDHVDLVKMAGLEKFIGSGSLDESARTCASSLRGTCRRYRSGEDRPGDRAALAHRGPGTAAGRPHAARFTVADVFAGNGLLWIAVNVVPGELAKTAVASPAPTAPPTTGDPK